MLSDLGREFGIGFYVTPELTLAESQAKRKAKQGLVYDAHRPVVTEFEFDADAAAKGVEAEKAGWLFGRMAGFYHAVLYRHPFCSSV